ncbi:membrane-associated guanylate kinase, WW and PDZ domain-containing protein 3-like isoform X1 [Cyprinus carpio]|uniref:Membrane-associated guanylate kinase, WW and PDZ domain-containing protein 3 n=1 Tax=Cyprinus carpio TaxID=7962 RepID=A0A9Q9XSU4_CYPCA|nr:membrane-associated guanylate kinase, WW and PDZ domain-containing protein 3-like isoform X1 [Cyprinus carpio]XP_042607367.1 membrane-associated guanylate kinase, WW and PDZ domain-containing protein 3-like isoform X1 [Cyprinus carpio]XP_042607369.1 membrane-associated guanylate kinase, WW and PDZ domain-containing protein 3-like isoform X1 [Cyprinus carpio]XP_042607370.1 membrane-associated guanylate kinase, WW and PDZ domain-containing protein 3-like isoform X1 [Cyprinus carpio]XP_04260737
MSKTLKKKKHWSGKVQECAVSWGNAGELSAVLEIRGGAEHGEFPHLGQVLPDALVCHVGRLPGPGDVLLEVNGTPVSGLTNRDTLAVIRHFREPLRLKTVKPGNVLNTDLRHYLSLQFQKGSLDHKLQQVIRDNLYLRTIPCTTRQPREGEVPGVDYNFISVGEFRVLEESGLLLESGTYDGNYYGTPKPPAEPSPVQPDLVDQVLFDEEFDAEVQRKRTTSVSKMDRKDSAAPEEEEEDERPPMVNGLTEHKEGPEWRKAVPSYTQSSSSMDFRNWNTQPRDESQEPLPKNWEMAYTETGMVYFIDHNTKTTTWLDPRLAKKAKPPEKCDDGELPYGWEKIEDPQYGTYYVDHINQKTQFENPVQEAKKKLSQDASPTSQPIAAAAGAVPTPLNETGLRGFTRDPSQLHGAILRTTLKKSPQGFGFTIIGGDRPDEFLQVKNVLRDGPAAHDNKIASGDVIVDINGTCVLGKTHADVVQMFQSIPVNQYVDMVLCRGYPLPEDTNSSEEGTGDITAMPGMDGQPIHLDGAPSMQDLHYMTTDGRHPAAAMPNGRYPEAGETTLLQPELVSVPLVKGPSGFGFAIADCPLGQKVKMILDAQWCRGLLKGDVIKEINRQNVQTLTHAQVVDILKDLPMGSEVNVLVLRGGQTSPVKSLKPITPAIPSSQKQDIASSSVSTETPSPAEPGPQSLPFPPHAIRSNSPKLDPSELYLKSKAMLDSKPANTKELDVFIRRNQETGFGFRVLGGEGPDQPVYIGAIVPLGAAEKDGRLRAGDELICIDGVPVKGKSHKQVLELMTNAARNGQVMLTVRRKHTYPAEKEEDDGGQPQAPHAPVLVNGSPKPPHIEVSGHSHPQPYDVTLQRKDNEGFGFVILTSKNKPPPGVIPHKIGRIIDGSPTDRCGRLKVGDRISAVNGQSIIDLSHNDIVQLIKEAGNAVTLTVVPEEEHSGPPSGTSSAKQSPATQHRAVGQQPASRDDRNGIETDERKDTMARVEYKSQPQGEMATVITSGPKQGCYPVELERGQRGFGFSLRGGKEYNMGLFILRLAEDGPALKDGRIHVGDQIVEINGEPTQGITHTRAIELIQAGGNKVLLLLRPGLGLVPDHNVKDMMTGPSANSPRYSASNEPSTPSSPSFMSHSPEVKPSPPEELFFDPLATSHGQLHQHYRDTKQQTRKSDPSMPRDNNDNFTLPRRQDGKERSRSPKKTLNMDNRNDPSEREPRSASPRKTKKENSGIRQEMPQKATDGLKPNSGRRYKDEDTMHKQDRETGETRPEVSRGGSDRYQRDKTAEPQRSESSTLNRKDHRGRDRPEDIEGMPQETPHNGNPTTKRAPITPGPWKVPSSTRVQPPVHGV